MGEPGKNEDTADKLNFTFEFTVKELSKIAEEKDKEFWSPEYSVGGLTWKISVGKEIADENDSIPGKINLSVYVHVMGKPKLWCCFAKFCIKILSQKEDVEDISEVFERSFSAVENCCGLNEFIDWNFLMDPENGYLKNNAIKLQVRVIADPPQNMDKNSEETPEPPENPDDWLDLFEEGLNKTLVCRLVEEFKGMTNSLKKELENAVKISKKSLKKSILLVRKDVSVMKGEIFDTVKEEINKGKCSNNEDDGTSGPQRTEAVKNLVDKMLSDFKNDMMKEFSTRKYPCVETMNSCDFVPCCEHREHLSTRTHCGSRMESNYQPCQFNLPHREAIRYDLPQRFVPNKRKKIEQGYSSSAGSQKRQFQKIDHFSKQNGCDSDSSDSSCYVVGGIKRKVSKPFIPSEEEALQKNLNLNKRWKKELLLIGKDDEGKLEAHKATCLKELYDLQKKYIEYDILKSIIV